MNNNSNGKPVGSMKSPFTPMVDKVGVPLLWFGMGLLVGFLMSRKSPGPRRLAGS
jgi:hypothetical protein